MGKKCYYFFKSQHEQDWNTSRKQCTGMDSDLVIIDSTEELVRSKFVGLLPGLL